MLKDLYQFRSRGTVGKNYTGKKGVTYKWLVKKKNIWEHPMHLHGHHFRLFSRNSRPLDPQPWLDTLLLAPDEVVKVMFVADNPSDWLYYCYILEHHSAGMGAIIRVV